MNQQTSNKVMKRSASDYLAKWKEKTNHKPLLVYGARQVGKTYVLKEFGRQHYKSCTYIDLERDGRIRALFEANENADLNPERILSLIETLTGNRIVPGESLLIFDEVQASNRALASLKYFYEQLPQLDIIAAGSLLGVTVNTKGFTMPVGKVQTYTMHPMSFPEFLCAYGQEQLLAEIQRCFETGEAFFLHEQLLEYLWTYVITGGMPEAIQTYIGTGDWSAVAQVQDDIRALYVADMAKYATAGETARIRDVWESIPGQLARENKKFQYKAVKSGGRARVYEGAISWLLLAGLVNRCTHVSSGYSPITVHEDSSMFKLYMADTGLLARAEGLTASMLFDANMRTKLDLGGLGENLIAQMLTANNIPLHYWTSSGNAEVDFVYEKDAVAGGIPVEVKTSDNVRSKSLGVYRSKYEPDEVIRISTRNFGIENGIKSIPLYAAWCIEK